MMRLLLLTALMLLGRAVQAAPLTGEFDSIDGGTLAIEDWRGQPVLVVNTASKCGNTPQYDGLEKLYADYGDAGLVVLGFPSNDFMGQEPGTEEQIQEFCRLTYNVKFPMFEKTTVKSDAAHPFFAQLAADSGTYPRWNFHKYLVGCLAGGCAVVSV